MLSNASMYSTSFRAIWSLSGASLRGRALTGGPVVSMWSVIRRLFRIRTLAIVNTNLKVRRSPRFILSEGVPYVMIGELFAARRPNISCGFVLSSLEGGIMLTSEPVSNRKRSLDSRSVTYKRRPVCCWPVALVATRGWPGRFPPSMVDGSSGLSHRIAGDTNRHHPVLLVCYQSLNVNWTTDVTDSYPTFELEKLWGRDLC